MVRRGSGVRVPASASRKTCKSGQSATPARGARWARGRGWGRNWGRTGPNESWPPACQELIGRRCSRRGGIRVSPSWRRRTGAAAKKGMPRRACRTGPPRSGAAQTLNICPTSTRLVLPCPLKWLITKHAHRRAREFLRGDAELLLDAQSAAVRLRHPGQTPRADLSEQIGDLELDLGVRPLGRAEVTEFDQSASPSIRQLRREQRRPRGRPGREDRRPSVMPRARASSLS
jgi:hypothetical protein